MASAAQERRNAAARSLGYRNYYARRIAESRARGESLSTARGHARDDLEAALRSSRTASVTPEAVRGPDGRYSRVTFVVVDVDGRERRYTLKGKITDAKLRGIADDLKGAGVPLLPGYETGGKRGGPPK